MTFTFSGFYTVRVFKNDARLWKPFHCCSAFPLLTRLGRHKRSSGRRKRSPGRSVSEAAPRFGNLCVFKPSALRKKPSASLEETFDSRKKPSNLQKKPSNLWRELCRKRISEKRSECQRHFFWCVPYLLIEHINKPTESKIRGWAKSKSNSQNNWVGLFLLCFYM